MQHSHIASVIIDEYQILLARMTMLEYCKLILEKVSFDPQLFRTELNKALRQLVPDDVIELKNWCVQRFGIGYCKFADPTFSL